MKLHDIKIGTRLSAGFGFVLLLLLLVLGIGLQRFQSIGKATATLVDADWARAEAAATVNALTSANARRTLELFVAPDKAARDKVLAYVESNKQEIGSALATLQRLSTRAEGQALLLEVTARRVAYVESFTQVSTLVEAGQREQAQKLVLDETMPRLDALREQVSALNAYQKRIAQDGGKSVQEQIASGSAVMLALGAAALAAGIAFALLLTRSIVHPLRRALGVAQCVAGGDLSSRIDADSADEVGELLVALKTMNGKLADMVSQVREGTETIATASTQIATGNFDLAARTEMQASSLQETAASMEQLTGAVQQNAASARQASELASATSKITIDGSAAVERVAATMNGISASARRIEDITGIIDGIAFQTNILALNAAVEAARAGEQGRGFAVVASEVRNLAQRSAAAAKEIKVLIGDSVEQIGDGTRLTSLAGDTMRQALASVQRVTGLVAEISSASDEQRRGIEQVNQAVSQMDDVTQQNAALVEQAAAAAQSLKDQAGALNESVRRFRLGASALAAPPARQQLALGIAA